jgi:uncharacterized protein (UPF0262 family)
MSLNENQQFQKLVKKFKDTCDSLKSNIKSSDNMIIEHCEMIRNQIDTRTESLIQKLEKKRDSTFKNT